MNDHRILELIRTGQNDLALNTLYRNFPMIRKLVRSKGGTTKDAEDIFQEALIILLNKARDPQFQLTSKLSTYLYSVSRFLWNDQLKRRHPHVPIEEEPTGSTESTGPFEATGPSETATFTGETRQAVRHARQHYYRRTWLRWGGAGLGTVIVAGLIVALLFRQLSDGHHPTPDRTPHNPATAPARDSSASTQPVPGQPTYRNDTLPAVNEKGAARWSTADSILPAETFWLSPVRDTVIETSGGIVLSIPASAFLDSTNRPVTGTVEFVIKEALDAATILKAGLSTMAGDQLLETGGMFYIDARQHGKPLRIDPTHAIYAEIPTDSVRPGMQLFTGNRLAGGTIDWTNPQPLEHDLVPVDIHLLDFYPPHYLDSVAQWGYDADNRTFTDSLYYAFSSFFTLPARDSTGIETMRGHGYVKPDTNIIVDTPRDTIIPRKPPKTDDTIAKPDERDLPAGCAINPARIAAIWNNTFQNTLIATREFEQRLILIHQTGDNQLLDLYVNHPDQRLSTIDSIAATQTTGAFHTRFLAFAARHDGKVRHGDTRFDKLREYYRIKAKTFGDAMAKTTAEFREKEGKLDSIANGKAAQHSRDSVDRLNRNFAEELAVNFKSACIQLGYHYRIEQRGGTTILTDFTGYQPDLAASASYKVNINSTGWCNIDRYAVQQTIARRTIDYQDLTTGKRAVITYNPVHFNFTNIREYDRVYLYLLPDKLNSFMRLTDSAGVFTEQLNSEMSYRLVVIGYQGKQAFYYSQTNIQPTTYTPIPLVPVSDTDLDKRLSRLQQTGKATQIPDLKKDQAWFLFEARDHPRRDRDEMLRELTGKMLSAFFPCLGAREQDVNPTPAAK